MQTKKEAPKTNLRGSQNSGYLSRSAISCMTVAMRHWALDATRSPQELKFPGTPMEGE